MRETEKRVWPGGTPPVDPSHHRTRDELEAMWMSLEAPPVDDGEIVAVVTRGPNGHRQQPSLCRLDPIDGVVGDRWRDGKADPHMQVSIMRADLAHIIANGQPLALFGNNLLVDMDLSSQNLPVGTTLLVGTARCVVSPEPHNACSLFSKRFGHPALVLTADKRWRDQNLRGLYLTVIEAGEVGPGDSISVVQRP